MITKEQFNNLKPGDCVLVKVKIEAVYPKSQSISIGHYSDDTTFDMGGIHSVLDKPIAVGDTVRRVDAATVCTVVFLENGFAVIVKLGGVAPDATVAKIENLRRVSP